MQKNFKIVQKVYFSSSVLKLCITCSFTALEENLSIINYAK